MDELSAQEYDSIWNLASQVHRIWDARTDLDGSTIEVEDRTSESPHVHVCLAPRRKQEEAVVGESRDEISGQLSQAKSDYVDFGSWQQLRSGQWLWDLIQKSFRIYWEKANVEYFEAKYGTHDKEKIAEKLIAVTAKNAAALGGLTGVAMSGNEILALITAGEGGLGIPANLAIAATGIGSEAILLVRFQLQLVANLGKLYGVPLDPEDPEDILTILAFALGGSAASAAGKAGMKVGSRIAARTVKTVVSKEVLATLKRVAAQIGIKILQRTIVRYTIPVASIAIGAGWNYGSVKAVAKVARRHFKERTRELGAAAAG